MSEGVSRLLSRLQAIFAEIQSWSHYDTLTHRPTHTPPHTELTRQRRQQQLQINASQEEKGNKKIRKGIKKGNSQRKTKHSSYSITLSNKLP